MAKVSCSRFSNNCFMCTTTPGCYFGFFHDTGASACFRKSDEPGIVTGRIDFGDSELCPNFFPFSLEECFRFGVGFVVIACMALIPYGLYRLIRFATHTYHDIYGPVDDASFRHHRGDNEPQRPQQRRLRQVHELDLHNPPSPPRPHQSPSRLRRPPRPPPSSSHSASTSASRDFRSASEPPSNVRSVRERSLIRELSSNLLDKISELVGEEEEGDEMELVVIRHRVSPSPEPPTPGPNPNIPIISPYVPVAHRLRDQPRRRYNY